MPENEANTALVPDEVDYGVGGGSGKGVGP